MKSETETAILLLMVFVAMLLSAVSGPPPDISDDVGICNRPTAQMSC